ncbi:PfkB family carbohydrate kinase [Leeia oryzae]|uniref:PfkB family carbohydrate kinase n=1 Tax=Leeia oryzae TaxID=356662 RepID=UPI00035C3903|nr:PfkB family carbohydrate kinase [Leeia oryzae]
MLSILGLGDNTFDVYLDKGLEYPGGNAVNVAVFAARLGCRAAYLGRVGCDAEGDYLRHCLALESVDVSRLQVDETHATAWACVTHQEGDRLFLGSEQGASAQLVLAEEDVEQLAAYNLVHTSIYSHLVHQLPQIRLAAKYLSFDFSDDWTSDLLNQVAPFLDIGFVSMADKSEAEVQSVLARLTGLGTKIAVATLGKAGVVVFDGVNMYQAESLPVAVVDTLGAGDGFIAGFLVSWLQYQSINKALNAGLAYAAQVCQSEGGFGYPRNTPDDRWEKLKRQFLM